MLFLLILAGTAALAGPAVHSEGLKLYVAPNGSDAWSGKRPAPGGGDGPFATLERARDAIRALKQAGPLNGGVTVELAAGIYERSHPFELSAEDSGTEASPVIYRSRPGAEVRLVGGKQVTNFQPVTDPGVLNRLPEIARGKVLQADLKALQVTDLGEVASGSNRLELFFQDRPMTVARWPNEGFVKISDVLGPTPVNVRGTRGTKEGIFSYEGDRPNRWVGEKDIWLHGYWFWDWAEQRQKVQSIDTTRKIITLAPPYHSYGYRKGQWFYAFNLLSELDSPGEYYVDRDTGILYFWPPAPLNRGRAFVSVAPSLVQVRDASNVTFQGLTLEAARGTAVVINGATNVRFVGCTIRNVGDWAVQVNGGRSDAVVGCDIYETGAGGIALNGGDRKTLTPAGHLAENNHIYRYARWARVYNPGITLGGVGNRAAHNLIDNAPHMAIGFNGNNHVIEYNEIHSVCYESNDAGAMYAGRNWTMRGTIVRYNYLHDISGFEGRGCVGVYLDDQFSGTQIYGNLFNRVTRAAMIGGGRDCTIENNIFVDCVPATHVDARGLGWAADGFEGLKRSLEDMPYREGIWAAQYPKLVNILADDPMAPKGNLVARNICVGGRWGDFEGKAKPFITFEDNLLDQDPHFVDSRRGDFRLKPDSPALKLGFKPIPIEAIGLEHDSTRASWPVKSIVRPAVTPPVAARRTEAAPVFRVARATEAVAIDGVIRPAEWGGANPARAMVVEEEINGEKSPLRSLAWLSHDDSALLVAVDTAVDPTHPLHPGDKWGQDDAVEIAIRSGQDVLVLRGYPSGHVESSDEAGASSAATRRVLQGTQYSAKIIGPGQWTATWRIPFASLGIDPVRQTRYPFNLSVHRSSGPAWVEWHGTGGSTWEVDRAGIIEFAR